MRGPRKSQKPEKKCFLERGPRKSLLGPEKKWDPPVQDYHHACRESVGTHTLVLSTPLVAVAGCEL